MPLQPGTALQNGHYVIDALLEAAPMGSLYWATHVVTGTRVYVQTFNLLDERPATEIGDLISRLEGLSFASESLLPNPLQIFHEEKERILCLVLGATVGLPWSQQGNHSPLPPAKALQTIRRIATGLTWLAAKDFVVTTLLPTQVWLAPEGDRITLTSLPTGYLTSTSSESRTVVQSLAYLLGSFLTGNPSAGAIPPETLINNLQQQLPQLNPALLKALYQGMTAQADADTSLELSQWLILLPEDPLSSTASPMKAPQYIGQPQSERCPLKRSVGVYSALGVTALVAAIAGVALGSVWRLNAASLPGNIQFDPHQSFPSQTGWNGDTPEEASFARPTPAERPMLREPVSDDNDWTEPVVPPPTSEETDWVESDRDIRQLEKSRDPVPQEEVQVGELDTPDHELPPVTELGDPAVSPSTGSLTEEPTQKPASDSPLPVENETSEFFLKKPTPATPDEDVFSNAAEPDTSISPVVPNAKVESSSLSDS